eukprot:scaffold973_cov399-Prasinococcus_capsulatus_cf.AAC.18
MELRSVVAHAGCTAEVGCGTSPLVYSCSGRDPAYCSRFHTAQSRFSTQPAPMAMGLAAFSR